MKRRSLADLFGLSGPPIAEIAQSIFVVLVVVTLISIIYSTYVHYKDLGRNRASWSEMNELSEKYWLYNFLHQFSAVLALALVCAMALNIRFLS